MKVNFQYYGLVSIGQFGEFTGILICHLVQGYTYLIVTTTIGSFFVTFGMYLRAMSLHCESMIQSISDLVDSAAIEREIRLKARLIDAVWFHNQANEWDKPEIDLHILMVIFSDPEYSNCVAGWWVRRFSFKWCLRHFLWHSCSVEMVSTILEYEFELCLNSIGNFKFSPRQFSRQFFFHVCKQWNVQGSYFLFWLVI